MFSESMEYSGLEAEEKEAADLADDMENQENKKKTEAVDAQGLKKAAGENVDEKKAKENISLIQEEAKDLFDDDQTAELEDLLIAGIDSPLLSAAAKDSAKQALAFSKGSYSVEADEQDKNPEDTVEKIGEEGAR